MLGASDGPSLKFICRAQWVQWGAIAAYVHFGGISELDNERSEAKLVHHSIVVLAVTMVALFAAAAQFDDSAAQRKVLQFAIGGYAMILLGDLRLDDFDYNKVYEHLPCYAFILLNLMALVASVYLWHYDDQFIYASESKLPLVARVVATLFVIRSAVLLWWSQKGPTGSDMMPSLGDDVELLLTVPAALCAAVAFILIGASFCDEEALHKTLQYSLVFHILVVWARVEYLYVVNSAFHNQLFFGILEILGCVYFLYPANKYKTLLRFAYTFCFLYAFLGIVHPVLLHNLGVVRTGSVEAAELIGPSWGLIGALLAAAARFEEEDQRKVLRCSMIAAFVIAAHSAYQHGYWDKTLWTFAALSFATLNCSCCMKLCTGGRWEEGTKKSKGKAVSPGKTKKKSH